MKPIAVAAAMCVWAGASGAEQVEIGPVAKGQDRILGVVEADHHDSGFGGLSGLIVSPNGETFQAVGDNGRWVTGRLLRRNGRLVDVEVRDVEIIRDLEGDALNRHQRDAEGMASVGDVVLVSFETIDLLRQIKRGRETNSPEKIRPRLAGNAGVEALAAHPVHGILMIPEAEGAARWVQHGEMRETPYPRRPPLRPTGADIGPDGRLYVVERGFSLLGGFTIELRRFTLTGDAITGGETLFRATTPQGIDNVEGVSVWRAEDGLRAVLVSDDNFSPLQRTLFLEVSVD